MLITASCVLVRADRALSPSEFSVAKVFVTMRLMSAVGMRKFWTDEKEP